MLQSKINTCNKQRKHAIQWKNNQLKVNSLFKKCFLPIKMCRENCVKIYKMEKDASIKVTC